MTTRVGGWIIALIVDARTSPSGAAEDVEIAALTRRLLGCYQEGLDAAQRSPFIRLIPLRATGMGRHLRLPRLRLLFGYFVVLHAGRAVGELKRRMHRAAVLADDTRRFEREIELLGRFEQSLPRIPSRSLLLGLVVVVLLVSYGTARAFGGSNHDLRPFASLISGVFQVSRGEVVGALRDYSWYAAYFTALGMAVSLWIVLLLPMTSFQLKRMVFNLVPGAEEKLGRTTLVENRPPLGGVYSIEEELFRKLDATPPRELRFDLALEAVLIVLTIGLASYAAFDVAHVSEGRTNTQSLAKPWDLLREGGPERIGALVLTALLVFRLLGLAQASHGRRKPTHHPTRPRPQPVVRVYGEPASWRRRATALVLDQTAVFFLWFLLVVPIVALEDALGTNGSMVLFYLAFPLAPALYGLPWLRWGSPERGFRQPGKRMLGLAVLATDGTPPTTRMVIVREVVGKWLLFGLILPIWLLIDFVWALRDGRRRALHDKMAGTIVVRTRSAEEIAAMPVSN